MKDRRTDKKKINSLISGYDNNLIDLHEIMQIKYYINGLDWKLIERF